MSTKSAKRKKKENIKNQRLLIAILLIVVVLLGIYFLYQSNAKATGNVVFADEVQQEQQAQQETQQTQQTNNQQTQGTQQGSTSSGLLAGGWLERWYLKISDWATPDFIYKVGTTTSSSSSSQSTQGQKVTFADETGQGESGGAQQAKTKEDMLYTFLKGFLGFSTKGTILGRIGDNIGYIFSSIVLGILTAIFLKIIVSLDKLDENILKKYSFTAKIVKLVPWSMIIVAFPILYGTLLYFPIINVISKLFLFGPGSWDWVQNLIGFPIYLIICPPLIAAYFLFFWWVPGAIRAGIINAREKWKERKVRKNSRLGTVVIEESGKVAGEDNL